ncbi:MAG TPA: helix-turn-helix domain-containing protein [Chloroflexota bacterium]|nr:helix-turn-helix domain-containing protein [Chloroflexota bacterium]
MYRVSLTAEQMEELNRLCCDCKTQPPTRTRLEMLRLAHAGWTIPRIARHFGLTESRARHWVKAFLSDGFTALENKKSPGPKRKLTPEILAHLKQVVGQDGRTWTAPQVLEWLQEQYGLVVNRTWLCEVMNQNGMRYKRTTRTLRHKQKPEQVAVKRADLETLKRGQKPD